MSTGPHTTADYYATLGVSKEAPQDDLKKAYEEAAAILKGGDPEKLKELHLAYEVLSNPVRRKRYHYYRRDVVSTLEVSLEDLYNGTSMEKHTPRLAICSQCNGRGSKSDASTVTCFSCQGSGQKPYISHFIPGTLHLCVQCKGSGVTHSETISEEERCEQCKGEKVLHTTRLLVVPVEKGMQNGQKITLPIDVYRAATGGAFVFILQQKEHLNFKRKGDDLFVEHTISAFDALFGFKFVLTHLDDRKLIIKCKPGEVCKTGQFKAISDEGMPVYQEPSMKGKLYIHFTVDSPDALTDGLTPEQRKTIETVLHPSPSTDMEVDEGKETTLDDVDQQQAQEAYDDMHREMKKIKDMPRETALHDRKSQMTRIHEEALKEDEEMFSWLIELKEKERAADMKLMLKEDEMLKKLKEDVRKLLNGDFQDLRNRVGWRSGTSNTSDV